MRGSTIYLMRHAESQHNAAFSSGATFVDVDELGSHLTMTGIQQAEKAAGIISRARLRAIYSSDYYRSVETAQIINRRLLLPHTQIKELRERQWGSLDGKNFGKTLDKISQLQKDLSEKSKMKVKITEDMESEWEAALRIEAMLNQLASKHLDEEILVISHGTSIRAFLIKLGFRSYDQLGVSAIANCGYVVLQSDAKQGWQVQSSEGVL